MIDNKDKKISLLCKDDINWLKQIDIYIAYQ